MKKIFEDMRSVGASVAVFTNLQFFADGDEAGSLDASAQMIDRSGAESLIPLEESKTIIQNVVERSTVLSQGRRLANMTSRQLKIPVLESLPVAYFVNGDTGQKQTAKVMWDKKYITAEEIAVIVPVPENVLDDAAYDIWGEVRPRIVEAFDKKIDEAILFGTDAPSTWRDDIVTTAVNAGNVVSLGDGDLYDKVMSENGIIAKVEEAGYFVNGNIGDISLRAKLRALRDTTGQPIFKSDVQSATRYSLDGEPMLFPRNGAWDKSRALMISGDFSQLVYAIRQDLTFKLFTEGIVQNPDGSIAYNLMQNDMIALRAVMRLGWEMPNPINQLKPKKSQRSPFAVLTV